MIEHEHSRLVQRDGDVAFLSPSVELTRTKDGAKSWRIRAYAASVDEAADMAMATDQKLCDRYGINSGQRSTA